jgi:hypothetical protein
VSSVIRLRRGTSAQWASSTIVLAVAELGLDTTLNKLKVGNGMHTWPNLPYINVLPSELAELSQDAINSALVMGLHMSKNYDDNSNTITIESTLTNVDNTSDANKPISTATQTALDLKSPIASPIFTGTPSAPTALSSTNTTQIATTEFVQTAIANVIDLAPAALDTLNELAAAINDDASYASTVTTALSAKASLTGIETLTNKTLTSPTILAPGVIISVTSSSISEVSGLWAESTTLIKNYSEMMISSATQLTIQNSNFDNNGTYPISVSGTDITITSGSINSITEFNDVSAGLIILFSGNVDISPSEIGSLNGVTSPIQAQLNSKAPTLNPTFTGSVSGISKSMVGLGNVDNTSDLDKPISGATATRIGLIEDALVDGLASKIDKATIPSIKSETEYTINNQTDRYNRLEFDASTPITVTIPANLSDPWPIGSSCEIMQAGSGKITVVGQSGVTLNAPDNQFKTRVQWSTLILEKRGENNWLVSGDSDL